MHHIFLCLFDEFIAKGEEKCTKDSLLKVGENVENMINSEKCVRDAFESLRGSFLLVLQLVCVLWLS